MSKALRETKCLRRSTALRRADEPAGAAPHHVGLARLRVPSRTAWLPQAGQTSGNSIGLRAARAASPGPRPAPAGSRRRRAAPSPCRRCGCPCARSRPRCAAWRSRRRRRPPSPARARRPASARRCGRPGSRCPAAGRGLLGRELVGDGPARASARRSPAAPASPAGSPCRRRRRCHSRASAPRLPDLAIVGQHFLDVAQSRISGLIGKPQCANASTTSDCVLAGSARRAPQA